MAARNLSCMDLPESLFVKAVPNSDDIVAFQFPFALEGKAVEGAAATTVLEEMEDGDLIIEGWAAEFDGIDRQGENFIPGAFQRGIKAFMDGSASLCFHHKQDHVLGKVLDLQEVEGKGLKMRARVDGAIRQHPVLGTIYSQIKRGTFKNLSVGGFFHRVATAAGPRIGDMDFTEISVTGVPIHTKPSFAVVAGKALTTEPDVVDGATVTDDDLAGVSAVLSGLSKTLDSISTAATPEGKAVKGDSLDLRPLPGGGA